MNLFETVKASVSVPDAAKRYGIRADRHGMALCPFHEDRHPSLKLNQDYYYCYGCGATGDVTDFVSRLFSLRPYDAAKKLAEDFGIDPDRQPSRSTPVKHKHPLTAMFREDERYCQRVLCDYLHLLEDWKERYVPKSMEEEPDERFVEACRMKDTVEYLADVLTVGSLEVRIAAVKDLMADGRIGALEERIRTMKNDERGSGINVKKGYEAG